MPIKDSSLILVAVINKLRDMEIARLLGWYRIPIRSAPKIIAVDHLAFYQTGAFGDEKWQITYTAGLRGHELTTRLELLRDEPDHPHAQHEYYKLQLGPLERLAHPILANKWRRITFFYTTGEYFLRAQTIDDLVVETQERQSLWLALRERAGMFAPNAGFETQKDPLKDVDLDPQVLALLLGLRESDGIYDP